MSQVCTHCNKNVSHKPTQKVSVKHHEENDKEKECVQCTKEDRKNQNRLDPLLLNIIYEDSEQITSLCLPRKYTTTHNDVPPTLFAGIGHEYNKRLLSTEEVIKNQTEIIGKWVKKDCKYEIHLKAIVSTKENPQAEIRNMIICRELGTVLESIAFAETALLKLHPELKSTKIFVHFKSIDPKYNRTEYWHRLGYWQKKN